MMDMDKFSTLIKRELRRKGMIQKELAQEAGIAPASLTRLLHAKRTPNMYTVGLILDVLDLEMMIVRKDGERL